MGDSHLHHEPLWLIKILLREKAGEPYQEGRTGRVGWTTGAPSAPFTNDEGRRPPQDDAPRATGSDPDRTGPAESAESAGRYSDFTCETSDSSDFLASPKSIRVWGR